MKIVQRYPLHFNMTVTFELTDDRVIYSWTAWNGSGKTEYPLSSIGQITTIGTQSDKTFSNYGFFFVFCGIVSSFLSRLFWDGALTLVFIVSLIMAATFGILYLTIRDEYIVFRNPSGSYLFGIKNPSGTEEAKFVSALKNKLTDNSTH